MANKMKNTTTTITRPLRNEADYEAVLERIEALTDADDKDSSDDELELLETLVEDYEARQLEDPEDEDSEDLDDYELMSRFPEAETLSLANFKISNGNEVRFLGVPVLGEIMIGEIANAGVEDFLINGEMHPVEIFQRLAPKDGPVPRMLSQIDHVNVFERRKVVDALNQTIDVSLDQLGIESTPVAAMSAGSCQPGPAGAQFFKDHHCNTGGGPGYGKAESYCFADGYQWVQKTSSAKRRATYTRIASCGSGLNRMRHFYKTVSGYKTQVNLYIDAQKVVSWWSAKKGIRRWRRVRFEAHEAGGWVRGWVKYHSQIAEGWF
jgi:antitoxin component HigA of HigAB toxin-antitoxin module